MILDGFLQFSSAQSIAAAVSTINSTNDIDLGVGLAGNPQIPSFAAGGGARDIGIGDDLDQELHGRIVTDADVSGATTSGERGDLRVTGEAYTKVDDVSADDGARYGSDGLGRGELEESVEDHVMFLSS